MGLDFSKTTTAAAPAATVVPDTKDEIAVVEQYDIVADREKMNSELVNSDEVDRIVSTIEVNNLETIVTFGAEVAEEISKASDVVLNSMNMSQLDDTSEMLKTLATRSLQNITRWARKSTRSMFSSKAMNQRSNSQTVN